MGNELNLYWYIYGKKKIVSVEQYKTDFNTFYTLAKKYYPDSLCSSQGSAFWPVLGEPLSFFYGFSSQFIKMAGKDSDLLSFHYYPQQSRRGPVASRRAFPSRLLNPENLDEVVYWADTTLKQRDRYAPGREIWLGETGNAQFGGEPGVSDVFIGGLWWLDQLGLLARTGIKVVVRQTLCGMNYGMIDDTTLIPNPDFWNSLLWKSLMGPSVYTISVKGDSSNKVRIYAHSAKGDKKGSYTILIINLDHKKTARVDLPNFTKKSYKLYRITTPNIVGKNLFLNGKKLEVTNKGLPQFNAEKIISKGIPCIQVAPLSYIFAVFND